MNNPMLSPENNARVKAITDQVMPVAAISGNDTPVVRSIVELALTMALAHPDFRSAFAESCKESPSSFPA